jgi:Ser/Thr protein kinase RdoA (MazF antagonist)
MKPYEDLTHRGKMRRMRTLAAAALDAYGLTAAPLHFFVDNGNIIYRTVAPFASPSQEPKELYEGTRCALRIHQPGYQSAQAISSELAWLAALRRESDAPVPEPIPNLDGKLLTQIGVPEVTGPRDCSLLRWVKGRLVTRGAGPRHYRAQGRLMAKLHAHAANWEPPSGFTRLAYDWDGLFGEGTGSGLSGSTIWELVPPRYFEGFEIVSATLRRIMADWGRGPDVYGVIHADLGMDANLLFHKGEARAIDFDDCRFGYWMFDLAIALEHIQEDPNLTRYRDALLEGYAEARFLPDEQVRQLPLFLAAVNALFIVWPVAMMHRFGLSDYWTARMDRAGDLIVRFVNGD